MVLTIVVMDNTEEFLQFLDPELCTLNETIEYGGLRTLKLTYQFQDRTEDKELFKIGNKIWIQGDTNLTDCLYVINTEVKQDIYRENSFELEVEEVLVELNYAPLFSQTELTSIKDTSNNPIFNLITTHGKQEVVVDWNALNEWFGAYFNIGVIQQCISEYASRISITGTINRMTLLRQIEEETGNIFVTRYEKDLLDNTIHRYLDFLNPINVNKNWQLNLEYDFRDTTNTTACYDKDDNETLEDKSWEIKRYSNAYIDENIEPGDDTSTIDTYDTLVDEPFDSESNEIYDYEQSPNYAVPENINPSNCDLRITDGTHQLNTDGEPYQTGDTPLKWNCNSIGLNTDSSYSHFISLNKQDETLSIDINNKSYAVSGLGNKKYPFLDELRDLDYGETITMNNDIDLSESDLLPDEVYLEIYDHVNDLVVFRTLLNISIGHVHEEVLDFGFNLENIVFNVDETNTYGGVSPVIQPNTDSGNGNDLSRTDIDTLINRWLDLEVSKGEVVPMVVEKVNVTASSLNAAKSSLGTSTTNANYWSRPLKPQDNTDNSSNTQYEFYRAVSYWKAPYTKYAGEMHVETEKIQNQQYTEIHSRPDTRDERQCIDSLKLGNTETSDEDVYAIYNQVALYLKEHEEPEVDIELDVANLQGYEYNNYDLHDKIYIKLPNTGELITTRVTKTTKEAHDVAKNSIEITNYRNVNTIKTLTHETYIDAGNIQFDYPQSKNLTARLINTAPDTDTNQYPALKLLVFTVYKLDNTSRSFTGNTYTKLTDANGYATVNLKFDPGDYQIDISFAGDEIYEESTLTVSVNVGGTLPQPVEDNKTTTKSKTTKKTSKKKTKTVKRYWTKCGLSPKNKKGIAPKIVSIAQPSSADAGKYNYSTLWKTVFKNYCPNCKTWGNLRFDGGAHNKCITSSTYGVNYKPSVPEHEVTCIKCDSDYCGVTGQEKSYGHISRLSTVESPKKSNKNEFTQLVKGKLLYDTKTVTVSSKKTENNQTRKIRQKGLSNSIKKKALAIVGNKTGRAALMAIVAWDDNNIKYSRYSNFLHSAASCLSSGRANCCDGTRLFFELCDAAGLTEYYNFYYVHVTGHVYGIIESKKTKKWRYVDPASDYHSCWGYVCQGYSHGGRTSKYPTLPF